MKPTKISKFLLFSFICIVIFLQGCASAPAVKKVPAHALIIDGKPYVSLNTLSRMYDIDSQWDSYSNTLTLRKGCNSAKILVDSSFAIVDGREERLRNPFQFYRGVIVAPLEFEERFAKQWMVSKSFIDVKPKLSLLGIQRVVVDPGHGGKDPGAIGKKGLKEKDVNLDIAKRLRKLLQTRGVSVVMTRSRDEFISLKKRASIANKANADFFISIHANASRSRNPRGFEIYYLRESSAGLRNSIYAEKFIESDFSQTQLDRSSKYAKAILWDMIYSENRAESVDLSRCILDSMSRQTSLKNRGIKTAGFAVLKNTRIPAILIEVGFLSNLKEERMLNNSFYRQQIAESIAGGIFNHNRQYRVVQR